MIRKVMKQFICNTAANTWNRMIPYNLHVISDPISFNLSGLI
jgi:hypothetical protein